MTQTGVIEQGSVTMQDDNLDILFMFCLVKGKTVTKRECMEITSDRENNKTCIISNCMSSLKACPTCLKVGDFKVMGHILTVCCEKRKSACSFHLRYPGAHRLESERKDDISKHLKKLQEVEKLKTSLQEVDHTRKALLQKKDDDKGVGGRDREKNIQIAAERRAAYKKASEEDEAINKEEKFGKVSQASVAAIQPPVADVAVCDIHEPVGEVATAGSSEKTEVMLVQTIAEMSQVDIQVEQQEESLKNSLPEADSDSNDSLEEQREVILEVSSVEESLKEKPVKTKVAQKRSVESSITTFSCPLRSRKKMIGEQRCTTFCRKFANNKSAGKQIVNLHGLFVRLV